MHLWLADKESQTPSVVPFPSASNFQAFVVAVHDADARCNSMSTVMKNQANQSQKNRHSTPTMTFVVIIVVAKPLISCPSSRPWSWMCPGTPSSCSCAACLLSSQYVSCIDMQIHRHSCDTMHRRREDVRCCLLAFSTLVAMP